MISLPFYSAFASCYQIELLAAVLRERGAAVETLHASYEFGVMMEEKGLLSLYKQLTSVRYFGDYLYLARRSPRQAKTILAEMNARIPQSQRYSLSQYREFFGVINQLHERILARLERQKPAVVGLSATHYQLVPSLYLARQIKQKLPDTRVVLGGYMSSLATAHDLLKMHPEIDWIVYGEGEAALPTLVRDLVAGTIPARGVQEGARTDELLLLPRYDDLIEAGPLPDQHVEHVAFNFELSRGCYWNKCNFCNFNATYGSFRKFGIERVISEMDRLHATYGARRFQFLDTSLPPRFADYLIRHELERPTYDIFCELMVDFDLARLKALRRFGVRRVQVGIESFSSAHLVAMTKNATLVDNIVFIANCKAADIEPVYGLMVNIPGETVEHLTETLEYMPRLRHLPPPKYVSGFDARPESPVFEDRQGHPFDVTFAPGVFDTVLPTADHNCEMRPSRVDFRLGDEGVRRRIILAIEAQMQLWRSAWSEGPPRLCLERSGDQTWLIDERAEQVQRTRLREDELAVLRELVMPRSRESIVRAFGLEAIRRMEDAGWLIASDGLIVSVVTMPRTASLAEGLVQLRSRRPTRPRSAPTQEAL